jgi:hypothetical protein
MESILDYLRRSLKEAGPARWGGIAQETGLKEVTLRKLAYDHDRDNPGLKTVEPLLDFFQAIERGERELPAAANDSEHKTRA